MKMIQALVDFEKQAQCWKAFFSARVCVALALWEDGDWRLWYSYTAFLPELPQNAEALNIQTQSMRAVRKITSFNDSTTFEGALREIVENPGVSRNDDWTAGLGLPTNHLGFEYEPLHPERFAGPSRLPALSVRAFNQNYAPLKWAKQLDQELQLHETPYDGFADLALALGIPVGLDQLNKVRFSEFVLIPPVE